MEKIGQLGHIVINKELQLDNHLLMLFNLINNKNLIKVIIFFLSIKKSMLLLNIQIHL